MILLNLDLRCVCLFDVADLLVCGLVQFVLEIEAVFSAAWLELLD